MSWPNLKTDHGWMPAFRLMPRKQFIWLALVLAACSAPQHQPQPPGPRETGENRPAGTEDSPKNQVRKFILLRHAEKEMHTADPQLSPEGRLRSGFLAAFYGDPGQAYQAVWSSDYRRTRQTAEPIAHRLGTQTRIYDPRDLPALADALLEDDLNAVIVGHSNTTPELASLLCKCAVPGMQEDDYEIGYLVIMLDGRGAVSPVDFRKTWRDRPSVND